MATYCIPKSEFNPETQAKIGEYIGAENCTAGCSGDGSTCTPTCGNGLTCCNSQCVDLQSDKNNCNGCGISCPNSQACVNGSCVGCNPACMEDESCCEGGMTCCKVCCNDSCCSDSDYCGEGDICTPCECTEPGTTCCGANCCDPGLICCGDGANKTCCEEGQYCENGHCASCQTPVCYPDQKCCSGICIDNPCGECPNSCPDGIVCCDGSCCTEGQLCCNNACTDIGTDTNCSGCSNACSEGTKCCDGACIDILNDTANCGGCGVVCSDPTPLCCNGVPTANGTNENCLSCGDTADPDNPTNPTSCCPSTIPVVGAPDTPTFIITNTNDDDNNCGGCGNVADTSEQVQQKCCGGQIVSLLTDNDNCGDCGIQVETGKLCCPSFQEPDEYGNVEPPSASIIDPQTDNDNCGSCGNNCNTPTSYISPGVDFGGNPLPGVRTFVDNGDICQEPGDEPFTKCKDGECVPCGTCNTPTNEPNSVPPYFHAEITIPCTYDPCGSVNSEGGDVVGKTCYGGCTYRAVGNVGNLQWELVSCICYDSCNLPSCTGSYAEEHGDPCPSVGICSAGEGPCSGCKYIDYENPIKYLCLSPWGNDSLEDCNFNPLGQYGISPTNYYCCDHEHPLGNWCGAGCPDIYEDNSQHFPTCTSCNGSCSAGLTCCGTFPNDACVNLKTDENNCGSCSNVCLEGQTCCDGVCKYLESDNDACGSCTNKCTGSLICCDSSCVDINDNDNNNCGSCGNQCPVGQCCNNGACVAADLQTDEDNCGSCGNECPQDNTCCLGVCKDLQTDENNCGFCGTICPEGEECILGICSYCPTNECPPENTCCTGQCKNLNTDESNCGTCGNACAAGETCLSGICYLPPLTIKLAFWAFLCASEFSNLANALPAGSRNLNYTITSGATTLASGSVSNIGPTGTATILDSISISVGTSFSINLSGYAGNKIISSTRTNGLLTYNAVTLAADDKNC